MTGFDRLRGHLVREYEKKTARSRAIFRRARKVMIEGGSHTIRLWRPYPFFAAAAEGARVRDVDGNYLHRLLAGALRQHPRPQSPARPERDRVLPRARRPPHRIRGRPPDRAGRDPRPRARRPRRQGPLHDLRHAGHDVRRHAGPGADGTGPCPQGRRRLARRFALPAEGRQVPCRRGVRRPGIGRASRRHRPADPGHPVQRLRRPPEGSSASTATASPASSSSRSSASAASSRPRRSTSSWPAA